MTTNEGQPSGQNPEWELNRKQNIAIAKRIESFLGVETPNRAERFKSMIQSKLEDAEELNNVEQIDFLQGQGLVGVEGDVVIPRELQEQLTDDDIEEITLGETVMLCHVDNRYRTLVLGIGFSDEAIDSGFLIGDMIEGLPEDFSYPVYTLREEERSTVNNNNFNVLASTKYGELPNSIVGANGLIYSVSNVYCLNLLGQGVRIDSIYEIDTMSDLRDALSGVGWSEERIGKELEKEKIAIESQKRRLSHVDFIPEEGFRAMPLTSKDYSMINGMFEQIDAGLYRQPQF